VKLVVCGMFVRFMGFGNLPLLPYRCLPPHIGLFSGWVWMFCLAEFLYYSVHYHIIVYVHKHTNA
jgi:type III secretory pathway component EscU